MSGTEPSQPEAALPLLDPDGIAGQVLSERYRVLRYLGEGAIGRVYQVEHLRIGRCFALKLLKPAHAASPSLRERFLCEARGGGLLDSPHTVAVVDSDVWRGTPYFVMQYLEGMNLEQLLRRERLLAFPRALKLILQACRGVRAAHRLGILHRDLKPSNLFIGEVQGEETCHVLDFGVAKQTEAVPASGAGLSTQTGSIIGTLAYMSAEQLRGDRDLDARADVYSLGAILYEALSGQRPFRDRASHELMYKILEQEPPLLSELRPELPAAVSQCVQRAMARRREDRFADAQALECTLSGLLKLSVGVAVAPSSRDPSRELSTLDEPLGPALPQEQAHTVRSTGWRMALPVSVAALTVGLMLGRGGAIDATAGSPTSAVTTVPPPAQRAVWDALESAPELPSAAPALPTPASGKTPVTEPRQKRRATESATRPALLPAPPSGSLRVPPAATTSKPAPAASEERASPRSAPGFDRVNPYQNAP